MARVDAAPAAPAASSGETISLDPRRNPAMLSAEIGAAVDGVARSSVRLTVVLVAAAYLILGLLSDAVPALAFLGRLPAWLPPALVTGAAAVLVALMPLALLPRRMVDAWVTLTTLAILSRRRWLARGERFPESTKVDAWLASHAGPEHALARAEALFGNGRMHVAALPAADDSAPIGERYIRAQLAWSIAFSRGDEAAAQEWRAELDRLLEAYPPGPKLAESRAALILVDAVRTYAADGDWIARLAEARPILGSQADGVLLRWFVLPRFLFYGRISLAIFVVVLVLLLAFPSP